MKRIYLILGIISLIVGILGFATRIIIGSAPPWLPDVSVAVGIVGLVGSWLCFFAGATSSQLEEFRKEVIALLREIRDLLRMRSKG